MRLAPRTLFGRNLLLLAGMIMLAQLLAGLLFFIFVQRPRTGETADMMAQHLIAVRDGLTALPASARADFVAHFNAQATPGAAPTPRPDRQLLPAERLLVRTLSQRLAEHGVEAVWRRERGALFVRIELDGHSYWLAARGPMPSARPGVSTLASWLLAFGLALLGAWLIQRRINRPLARLADAARAIEAGERPAPLPEDGPAEIAALAGGFNRMQTALADRERTRALMLAGISHDLRTPLSKLRLSVELLGDTPGAPPDPALLEGMAASCRGMDTIIGQFIDFARLDAAAPTTAVDVAAWVDAALAACPGGEAVRHHVATGLRVRGHAPALTRLLTNLVDNALKYGAAPVSVRAQAEGDSVRIAVIDGGVGISATGLSHLRQPFARGGEARGGPPGAGLGLAIADHIAERHGARLEFRHPPAGGFEVVLHLPRAQGAFAASTARPNHP